MNETVVQLDECELYAATLFFLVHIRYVSSCFFAYVTCFYLKVSVFITYLTIHDKIQFKIWEIGLLFPNQISI